MIINWKNMPPGEHKLSLPGNVGNIEAILHLPEPASGMETVEAMLICCHPHPQFGGTMSNKVVHTVCKIFSKMGVPSLRFNFRGVGKSEGRYDNGRGESEDLLLLCEMALGNCHDHQLWLAGFSFGSWVAAHSAVAAGAQQLLSIAPPVQHFDFTNLPIPTCPWLVVMGEQDEVVDPVMVFDWIDDQEKPPELIKFPETGHFFHGQLVKLSQILQSHYQSLL